MDLPAPGIDRSDTPGYPALRCKRGPVRLNVVPEVQCRPRHDDNNISRPDIAGSTSSAAGRSRWRRGRGRACDPALQTHASICMARISAYAAAQGLHDLS
jgi:hypothetical protein